MQSQISWLLQKPTDLDLHCLQRQCISGFSRTRVKFACKETLCQQKFLTSVYINNLYPFYLRYAITCSLLVYQTRISTQMIYKNKRAKLVTWSCINGNFYMDICRKLAPPISATIFLYPILCQAISFYHYYYLFFYFFFFLSRLTK